MRINSRHRLQALSTDMEPGALVDRDFEVVELAGRGSFSTVYQARQLSKSKRLVALKILHRGIQRHLEQQGAVTNPYLKEQLLCQRLTDAAVPGVVKVGETMEGRFYGAIEWAHGITLEDHMVENRAGMHPRQAVDVIVALGRTLVAMHGSGVIHRDLKPSNVMVDLRDDGSLDVQLLDFGIAKLIDEEDKEVDESMMVGTPAYMSPEQAAGLKSDPRSDIYSLGGMSYEMLTGTRHIQLGGLGTNSGDYIAYLLGERPIPSKRASEMNRQVPRAVDRILAWAVDRDPAKRPQQVGQFMDELVPILHRYEPPENDEGFLVRTWKKLTS